MKYVYLALLASVIFVSCSKRDYYDRGRDPYEWMRTHERGVVAYVDIYSGNYIVETYNGFAVLEYLGGITPREYDEEYAMFSHRGTQTLYNRQGDYFTHARIVDSWLTWSDALYVLDEISYR